jgi:hypothetical protein
MGRVRAYWDPGFDNSARNKKSKQEARRRRTSPDAQAMQVATQLARHARKNASDCPSSLLHIKR